MARHTWHRANNRMSDPDYVALPLETCAVLARLEDLMGDGQQLRGNLSVLAMYLGVDQKKYRLKTHLDSLIKAGYIVGASEVINSKEIRYILSLPEDHPSMVAAREKEGGKQEEKGRKGGRKPAEKEQKGSGKGAETGVNESANNAGSGDSSLNKILPSEGERELPSEAEGEAARENAPPAPTAAPVSELENWWAALKGRIPPLSPNEVDAIRQALSIQGHSVETIKASVKRQYDAKKAKGDPPSSFLYFIPGLKDDAQRRALMAAPIPTTPGPTAARAAPSKHRIKDQDHFEILQLSGMLDPETWENIDEFAPKEVTA